jgi:hypothetical protein
MVPPLFCPYLSESQKLRAPGRPVGCPGVLRWCDGVAVVLGSVPAQREGFGDAPADWVWNWVGAPRAGDTPASAGVQGG